MMSPWFLGTSVFYDTVLIKERLNLMNKPSQTRRWSRLKLLWLETTTKNKTRLGKNRSIPKTQLGFSLDQYHFSMHLSLILIKSFIINLKFYPFLRYYLKFSLIPGCCSQLIPENRYGFRKLVSRVSMFSQLC
jgi:hypothetical protein